MIRTKTLMAAIAATFALAVSAHADEFTVPYRLAPGACTAPIAIPVSSKPVVVAGTSITAGDQGVAQVTVLRARSQPALLSWTGADKSGFVHGDNSGAGVHVMYLDFAGWVDLQTAPSLQLQVCNSSSNTMGKASGYLTFFY